MFKNTKEAFLNCNIDTLTREFSLLHQKQDKNDGKSDCFHSIETEVLTAIKRIKKTQPIESNQQDLLIVCKSFEDTGDDVFCVEAKDFALWKKRHLKNQSISEYISDETLTFMDRNDILDACISIKVPQAYAIEFCKWEEILGWKLAEISIARYGLEHCLACVLWEMTFFGLNPEDMEREAERIKQETDDVKKRLENGAEPKTFHSIDELAREVLGDDYDENWYPKEEYERDMRNLVIASYKSTIEYERILEGETQV